MDRIEQHVQRWVAAGLISAEQAAAVRHYEDQSTQADGPQADGPQVDGSEVDGPQPSSGSERGDRRSQIAEAVGYVGAALAIGALALLLGELWEELLLGGRLALAGIVTVLLGGAWWVLRERPEAALARLTSALGTGTVAAVGWFTWVAVHDGLDLDRQDTQLALAGVVAIVAVGMYVARRRGLPQITAYVGVALVIAAAMDRTPLELSPAWWGVVFWSLGVSWVLLGAGGWLRPRRVAELFGGLAAMFALLVSAFGSQRAGLLALATATAGAFVVVAVLRDRTSALAVGATGLFVFVPQLTFELFGDAIGAPATLLMVGLLLVVLAVGIARIRRVVDEPGASPIHPDAEVRS